MSKRRSSFLHAFWSGRRTGMNLSNAEVNGIKSKNTKPTNPLAEFSHVVLTQPKPIRTRNKKQIEKDSHKQIHVFNRLLDEAEAAEDEGPEGKAENLYNRLIHFCKRQFSVDQYETAVACNHLALLHLRRGRFELAKPLFEKSLRILVRRRGTNHMHTRTVQANLADLFCRKARGRTASQ
jgi:hypothetical protein